MSQPQRKTIPVSPIIDLQQLVYAAVNGCVKNKQTKPAQIAAAISAALRTCFFTNGEPSDLAAKVKVPYSENTGKQGNHMVATKTRREPASSVNGQRKVTNARNRQPAGNGFAARVARAVIAWREKQGLSVVEASEKYGIPKAAWYRIENSAVQTTALYVDNLTEIMRLDLIDLLKAGTIDE